MFILKMFLSEDLMSNNNLFTMFDKKENFYKEDLDIQQIEKILSEDLYLDLIDRYCQISRSSPVRTLNDMSEEEIKNIEKTYGVPVIRPNKKGEKVNGKSVQEDIKSSK